MPSLLSNISPAFWSIPLLTASDGATGALIQQVCLDTKRHAVLKGLPEVDELELFRRLGLTLALVARQAPTTLK